LILDADDPDFLGHRFLRAAYRTTRALLICKELLNPGQSLHEAVLSRVDGDVLATRARISSASVFSDISSEAGILPTAPQDDSSPEEVEKIATSHGYAAIELGYEPEDPCLHWFKADQIQEFFPSTQALIEFEVELIEAAGKSLVRDGRIAAAQRIKNALGTPSVMERKDWTALPASYLRDYSSLPTEDDRALMLARLERIAAKARESLDIRTELSAMNAMARVQGLTFADDTKSQRELVLLLGNRGGRPDAPIPKLPPAS